MVKKVFLSILAVISVAATFAACGGSDDEPKTEIKIVSVVPAGILPGDACELTITVESTESPKGSSSVPWARLSQRTPTDKGAVFTFKFEQNKVEERKATLTITAGSAVKEITVTQALYVEPEPEPEPQLGDVPMLGLGWNLGNHFDAHNNGVASETAWGNPAATQALFDKLAADGLTTVRIPVTWLGKTGAAPDYKIDAAYLARVKEVVGFAEKAGLKAIINIHHDGANSQYWLNVKKASTDAAYNTEVKAQLAAMWQQIAETFKDKGDFLVFEPFNEIHDGGWGWGDNRKDGGKQYGVVNEWNETFVKTVRATGGNNANRWLAVVGYCANPDLTMEQLKMPADAANRLIVGVHFYDPTTFTLDCKYDEWGHTGRSGKKESWGDEDNVRKVFGALKSKYIDKGIPVYIGESGCSRHKTDRGELFRAYYLEYVAKAARDYGMALIIWDNGATGSGSECHGYYNHGNGSYIGNASKMIEALKRGYFTDTPGYTLQTVYDNAPN